MKRKHLIILLAVFLLPVCVYHKLTHMNEGELRWMKCYSEGDSLLFASNMNNTDTLIVDSIEIHNSFNPFNSNPKIGSEYEAVAYLNYHIIHNEYSMEGWFSIRKKEQKLPVEYSVMLCDRYAFDIKRQGLKDIVIGKEKFSDCIIFNESNSHYGKSQSMMCGVISLIWSKSRGLLQYSLENGEVFTLIGKIHRKQ